MKSPTIMQIKPQPKVNRKQRSYLKWAGLLPEKKTRSLGKRNKRLKKMYVSEFLVMVRRLEADKDGEI